MRQYDVIIATRLAMYVTCIRTHRRTPSASKVLAQGLQQLMQRVSLAGSQSKQIGYLELSTPRTILETGTTGNQRRELGRDVSGR